LAYIFATDSMAFIEIFAVGYRHWIFSATECIFAVQCHSRSIFFYRQSKARIRFPISPL